MPRGKIDIPFSGIKTWHYYFKDNIAEHVAFEKRILEIKSNNIYLNSQVNKIGSKGLLNRQTSVSE